MGDEHESQSQFLWVEVHKEIKENSKKINDIELSVNSLTVLCDEIGRRVKNLETCLLGNGEKGLSGHVYILYGSLGMLSLVILAVIGKLLAS